MEKEIEDLLAEVHAQRERVMEVQRSVERMEITGSAGNGEVTVRLKGTGQLTEVSIDPQAYRRYDAETVGCLVVEAANDGLRRLGEASRRRFEPIIAEASG
jgi:DNA-binding protein YbaB